MLFEIVNLSKLNDLAAIHIWNRNDARSRQKRFVGSQIELIQNDIPFYTKIIETSEPEYHLDDFPVSSVPKQKQPSWMPGKGE